MDKIARNRILQHILFWCLSFLILLNILKVSAEIQVIDFIYTFIFHIPVVLVVYINLMFLFRFLETRKFVLYGFFLSINLGVGAVFYLYLFDNWIDYVFSGYYFVAYYGFWNMVFYLSVFVAATSLIKLARGWFRLKEIEKEKTLTELKALKSQINPHFLFNSLNSIYSLSRKNSPVLPETVLKLSSLMRYVIYESDVDFIGLGKEIEVIKDYIKLQELRILSEEKITLKIEGDPEGHKIAPLLLLPFIENSFKHGLKGGAENAFVSIKLEITGKVLNFEIENSAGQSVEITESKFKGIGIHNVKKRLELIYPGAHAIKISENNGKYKVLLQLQLR